MNEVLQKAGIYRMARKHQKYRYACEKPQFVSYAKGHPDTSFYFGIIYDPTNTMIVAMAYQEGHIATETGWDFTFTLKFGTKFIANKKFVSVTSFSWYHENIVLK